MNWIADLRRRAGITEADQSVRDEYERDRQQAIYDEEMRMENDIRRKYHRIGLRTEKILVNIDSDEQTIEIAVILDDSEVRIGALAKLRELGLIDLTTRVTYRRAFRGDLALIRIETVRPYRRQQLPAIRT